MIALICMLIALLLALFIGLYPESPDERERRLEEYRKKRIRYLKRKEEESDEQD